MTSIVRVKMKAVWPSETLLFYHISTWHHNLEDHNLDHGNVCIVAVFLYYTLWKRSVREMGRWFTRAGKCYINFWSWYVYAMYLRHYAYCKYFVFTAFSPTFL